MKNTSEKVYDMVFALMFGPTKNPHLINVFLNEANRIIKDNGRVVVHSDLGTMEHFPKREKSNMVTLTPVGGMVYVAEKSGSYDPIKDHLPCETALHKAQ